jgi:putative transposase
VFTSLLRFSNIASLSAQNLMADKYQNKYRIPSARLPSWDYGSNGEYFITICTAKRRHYFGEIINGIMHLSEQGKKAYQYWMEIPEHFSFVSLDDFVVMPNHTHGIIIIDKPWDYNWGDAQVSPGVETGHALSLPRKSNESKPTDQPRKPEYPEQTGHALSLQPRETGQSNRSNQLRKWKQPEQTGHALSLQNNSTPPHARFRNQGIGTISSMVGSFKSALTNWCNENKYPFGWQTRFHDHIIRNNDEFQRIRNYIINNPANWEKDKFFKPKDPPLP